MNSRVAASERLVERIDAIVLDGVSDPERLAELGRLGAQLVIQRPPWRTRWPSSWVGPGTPVSPKRAAGATVSAHARSRPPRGR